MLGSERASTSTQRLAIYTIHLRTAPSCYTPEHAAPCYTPYILALHPSAIHPSTQRLPAVHRCQHSLKCWCCCCRCCRRRCCRRRAAADLFFPGCLGHRRCRWTSRYVNEEKKGQLFKLVDANGDGRLMYEELQNLLVCTLKTAEVVP